LRQLRLQCGDNLVVATLAQAASG